MTSQQDNKILRSLLSQIVATAQDLNIESVAGPGWRPPLHGFEDEMQWFATWARLQNVLSMAANHLDKGIQDSPPARTGRKKQTRRTGATS